MWMWVTEKQPLTPSPAKGVYWLTNDKVQGQGDFSQSVSRALSSDFLISLCLHLLPVILTLNLTLTLGLTMAVSPFLHN